MKVVGLIAEYNPFHNGHKFHIEKAKELTGADYVVVVMSGNFVQRGMPAIMPKHMRAEATLKNGASLVIELPVCYATGTAEQFAYGAVSILHRLGCVDTICFGSESGDIASLDKLANIFVNESAEYKTILQQKLRNGLSFPSARQKTVQLLYGEHLSTQILNEPNNILAIEYLKALIRLESSIKPVTLKRVGSNYHDSELNIHFSSATAIRECLCNGRFSDITSQIPSNILNSMQTSYKTRYPVCLNDFSLLLKHRLLQETASSLVSYADVSEELANRISRTINEFVSFDQYCGYLKSKELTYSRISRALLHVLLGVKKEHYTEINYAHVLGFHKNDDKLLSEIKKVSSIPLITKLSSVNGLNEFDMVMLNNDIYAANLYESVITNKFNTPFINEYEHPIVRT